MKKKTVLRHKRKECQKLKTQDLILIFEKLNLIVYVGT